MKAKKPKTFSRLISILLSVIQILLCLFIILKFFGAKEVPFVQWVNGLSTPLLTPFYNMFEPVTFAGHYVLDLSALFALIIYSGVGYILLKFLDMIGK
ncbi:YggT family protein [Terrilactibacillus sp. BCM23-1]|uniref:YggT family protein n=1 Tax=Terrilactibacillus tamarindi TaxID=2599694 RepID=A0A6N8CRP1_9BACI|nr:YggT family protein [Terrilactibacillus tamarindi]MTT30646.1 YggT family protein [Terrilactibacillus tamarindi]